MTKRIAATLAMAVLSCIAFASLLLAEGGGAPFAITSHDPPAHEVGVALNASVQAIFDDDMDVGTATNDTFVVHGHLGGLAGGTFAYDGGIRTLTLNPTRAFHAGEVLRVSATSGIASSGGAPLTPYGWQFTAGEVRDRRCASFADIGAGFAGVYGSSVAWGDVDNDGDLDILLTGDAGTAYVSKVYRNDGGGAFTDIGAGLTGVWLSSVAWGDYDNDGDLDILLTGSTGDFENLSPVSKVYRNDGSGAFTDISAGLTDVCFSSVAWGDYDNDGDLDILLTGYAGGSYVSKVYRNDGAGGFNDISAGLTGVCDSSVAWGDYDKDGDLDILLTGWTGSSEVSKVYRNDGGGAFTDIGAGLVGVTYSSVAWGDYDNDGDLDILLTGMSTVIRVSLVYRNGGGGSFTDIGAGLPGVFNSAAAWGDYDNDGDLDILLTGLSTDGRVSKVYRNYGGGGFTDIGAALIPVYWGSVAWGDYENDGDLDILLTGSSASGPVSKVYRSADCVDIVTHGPQAHEVGLSLGATITATFNADIELSTVTSRTFAVHGHLGGLAGGSFSYDGGSRTLALEPARTFYAGEVVHVSATSGISSTDALPVAPYGWQFTVGPVVDRRFAGFADIGASLIPVEWSSVAWGDYDNDGDLDILLTGSDGSTSVSKVYRNDGEASGFTDISAALTGMREGSVAWADAEGDGDLDILLTGGGVSKVYRNDGGGAFTDVWAGLPGVSFSSAAWGDYDNDGDQDIVLTGSGAGGPLSRVYRNDGGGASYDMAGLLTGVLYGAVAWGDYDNDGDLDIVLTGSGAGGPLSQVYRNEGGGAFAEIGAGLTGVSFSSVAWGDYDNDGDLDILLAGWTGSNGVSKVYRNDGSPSAFSEIPADLPGAIAGSAAWGDYDNDGDLDILISGYTGSSEVSKLYRNDGGATFTDIGDWLIPVYSSAVAWGDYDNDGDLDILLTGLDGSSTCVSKVYRNNSGPELGSVVPSSGSGPVGATTCFTTTWTDPDGWHNLKQCYFHIGASPVLAGNVTLMYNAAKDKLWLMDDGGANWTGGHAPGTATTLENNQATVDCSLTTKSGSGDTLSVKWAIQFKPGYSGDKKLGLKCKDRDKAKAKGKWKGTWTITP